MFFQADNAYSVRQHLDNEEPCLQVSSLSKTFVGRGTILSDISFSITKGDAVALIGGNGSGKSTLLRCCLRLVEPDHGKISFLKEDVISLNRPDLRRFRSRVGLVFQRHNLVPRLTVLTNVIHGAMGRIGGGPQSWWQSIASRQMREEAMDFLDKVGLSHLAASRADQLSGGESQRVAIARALMQKPDFMMADEPVASLDPKVGREVMDLLVELIHEKEITLVFVSHDLEHAIHYSTHLLGLQKGKLVMNGKTDVLRHGDLHEIYN